MMLDVIGIAAENDAASRPESPIDALAAGSDNRRRTAPP